MSAPVGSYRASVTAIWASAPQTLDELARAEAPRATWLSAVSDFVRQRPLGAVGAAIIVLVLVLAVTAGWVAPYDPLLNDYAAMLAAPSAGHWLGTDAF